MQETATQEPFSRSLVAIFCKNNYIYKIFKLFLDIGTVVGLMSHKKKEDSAQETAIRIMEKTR